MSRPNAAYPRSEMTSERFSRTGVPGSRVSRSTAKTSPWLTATWTAAAAANGPMIAGNDARSGTPTVPPSLMKVQPAAYALSA
jgi:hypothetical protein